MEIIKLAIPSFDLFVIIVGSFGVHEVFEKMLVWNDSYDSGKSAFQIDKALFKKKKSIKPFFFFFYFYSFSIT